MAKGTAYALLAVHGIKTLGRRLFGQRRGLEAFLDNYREDRLPPLTAEERGLLSSFDGCLACGLCDTLAVASDREDRTGLPGPSALPLSVSRHPPDYDALDAYLSRLDRQDLARMEAICPSRIPLRRLAQAVRDVVAREHRSGAPEQ